MPVVELMEVRKHYMLGETRVGALRAWTWSSNAGSSWPSPARPARARARVRPHRLRRPHGAGALRVLTRGWRIFMKKRGEPTYPPESDF